MAQVVDDSLEAGREAARRHAWREAYERLSAADSDRRFDADDLKALAEAAWWTGRLDEALALRERAYAAYETAGKKGSAAMVALTLSDDYGSKGSFSVARAWFGRAERLLAGEPEGLEHAHLALGRAFRAMVAGDLDAMMEDVERAYELGGRYGDRDVEALALVMKGRGLVLRGEVDQGLALLDEATASAVSGCLSPFSTGTVYCATIATCHNVGDLRRAAEWTEAAKRWCDRLDVTGFPGVCRVHHAEILRLRGEWPRAEEQAIAACEEVEAFDRFAAAAGFYEIGEIRRRRGDFAAAEEAYDRASELGRDPQPGRALLRLAQGKVDAAAAAIRRSLDDVEEPLARARRLPAQVEIAVAAGDLRTARAAAEELERTADAYRIGKERTPALEGAVRLASGQVRLAEGDWDEAVRELRRAVRTWQEVRAPYEGAHARMLLGIAYRRAGDEDGAMEELRAARASFTRLGAVLDEQRAAELLGEAETRRTFLFTDIVDSTKLLEALGDEKWRKLLAWHDGTLRGVITETGGEVIKQTGDGFFAAFDNPTTAVEAAVAVQRALDAQALAPDVRIGVHTAGAFRSDDLADYGGQGVHVAARIGALAAAGEILVSRETLDGVAVHFPISAARPVELKGVEDEVELVSVGWR